VCERVCFLFMCILTTRTLSDTVAAWVPVRGYRHTVWKQGKQLPLSTGTILLWWWKLFRSHQHGKNNILLLILQLNTQNHTYQLF
jgi:hypothetical protein